MIMFLFARRLFRIARTVNALVRALSTVTRICAAVLVDRRSAERSHTPGVAVRARAGGL